MENIGKKKEGYTQLRVYPFILFSRIILII